MRVCEHCKNDMNKGHIVYPEFTSEFYLCGKCFNKFYTNEMAKEMYKKDFQYYTEWEEENNSFENRDYIKLLNDIVANLESEIIDLKRFNVAYENNLEILDFVDSIVNAFREGEIR